MANILISMFFFTIDVFLLAMAGALRLFPSFLKTARALLREFMGFSFKLYRTILGEVAPFLKDGLGLDILSGTLRVCASVILSLVMGLFLLILLGFSITPFSFCLCVIHGLVVGIVWGKVDQPPTEEGFRTGVNLE